jgi:hypothetical protein
MPAKTSPSKIECLNASTGGRKKIDKTIYDLISKAIVQSLQNGKLLSYTGIVESIEDQFKKQAIKFDGSISWYAVTVKKDMEARGIISLSTEKGRKLHRLAK